MVLGRDASFTIEVTNAGDVPLTDVVVSDPLAPGCDASFASLGVGETQSYGCTVTVTDDFTNVDPQGKPDWALAVLSRTLRHHRAVASQLQVDPLRSRPSRGAGMNWDAIGAIAEPLGAIGVIASLVYLATQIRQSRQQMTQNTRALHAGTFQEFDRTMHESVNDALRVPGFDGVARLGLDNFDQLNEDDAFRFNVWMTSVFTRFDTAHYLFREGMLDESRWQRTVRQLRTFAEIPGVVQWWTRIRHQSLTPEFVALVSEILGEEAERKG